MKWNEVTWYSRLGAFILFFGVIPALAFYIGTEYREVAHLNPETVEPYSQPLKEAPADPAPLPSEVIDDPIVEDPIQETPITPKPTPTGTCYKGGCSGQLCTDNPDIVSTCEYREEYACYQSAVCERQSNGQCGWTETPALQMCLRNTDSI